MNILFINFDKYFLILRAYETEMFIQIFINWQHKLPDTAQILVLLIVCSVSDTKFYKYLLEGSEMKGYDWRSALMLFMHVGNDSSFW